MNRNQWILAAVLVVQLLLILLIRAPASGASSTSEARNLLPEFDAVSAERIALYGGEDEVELRRAGGTWRIESLGGFPADESRVDALLESLSDLRVRRPVVVSSRYHETLNIADDDNEGRIRVWPEGSDDPQVDLVLGNSPSYRLLHVRTADDDRVYETREASTADASPEASGWIAASIVDADPEELVSLTLGNEHGTIELRRDGESWSLVGPGTDPAQAIDADAVESLLRSATSLRFAAPEGPVERSRQGFDQPTVTLTLEWVPGGPSPSAEGEPMQSDAVVERTVLIGGRPAGEESKRYITYSDFGFAGTAWESALQALLDRKLEDLLTSVDDGA